MSGSMRSAVRVGGATALAAVALAVAVAPSLAAAGPSATTGGVRSVTFDSAILTGSVNPNGHATTYYFQIGRTRAYGSQTTPVELAGGVHTVAVHASVGGLQAVTTYHYRIVAVGTFGSAVGADRTFKTKAIPLSFQTTGVPNPVRYGSTFTIEGTLSGSGNANRQVELQQTPFPYVQPFQQVGNIELTDANGSFRFGGLSVPFATEFRVVGVGTKIVSASFFEQVALAVTLHATHHGSLVRFSGTITPPENGARVGIEKLTSKGWKAIAGTGAHALGTRKSRYVRKVRQRRGGFYRALVLPVNQGFYSASYSAPLLVRLR